MQSRLIQAPGRLEQDNAGLSLVELVLAMGILAFALTSVVGVSLTHYQNASTNRSRSTAILDAQAVLDQMRRHRDTGVEFPKGLVEAYPEGELDFEEASLPNQVVVIDYGDEESAPLEVTVAIQWSDLRGRPMEERLTTFLDRK